MQPILAYQSLPSRLPYSKPILRQLIVSDRRTDSDPVKPVLTKYFAGAGVAVPAVIAFLVLAPGWLKQSFGLAVGLGVVATMLANLATTVYLHRHLSHRTFEIKSPGLLMFFRLVIWTTTGMKPRNWAWWHRIHHFYEDESEDPHSPLHKGLAEVEIFNGAFFTHDQHRPWFLASMPPDLAGSEDAYDRRWFNRPKLGLGIGVGVGVVLYALIALPVLGWQAALETLLPAGFVLAYTHILLYLGLSGAVNSWCHWYGKVRFNNYARNSWFIAWLTMGEGNHNAHHGREWFAGLWASRWERVRDIGYHFLCVFRVLGWVGSWRMPKSDQLYLPQLRGISRWSKQQYSSDQAKQLAAA